MASMEDMPDLLILEIFKYLPPEDLLRLRQVCWQFRNLAECRTIWEEKHLRWNGENNTGRHGSKVARSAFFRALRVAPVIGTLTLYDLSISECEKLVTELRKRRPAVVKKIRMLFCTVEMRDFLTIFKFYGRELEHLEMWGCRDTSLDLIAVELSLPKLTTFHTYSAQYSGSSMQVVGNPWPELQHICLRAGSIEEFDQKRILSLKTQLRKLSLHIEQPSLDLGCMTKLLDVLKEGFPLLEHFVLSYDDIDLEDHFYNSSSPCSSSVCKILEGVQECLKITNVIFRFLIFYSTCSFDLCFDKGQCIKKLDKLTVNQICNNGPGCEFRNDWWQKRQDNFLRVLNLICSYFPDLDVVMVNGCSTFVSTARVTLTNSFPNVKFEFCSTPHPSSSMDTFSPFYFL